MRLFAAGGGAGEKRRKLKHINDGENENGEEEEEGAFNVLGLRVYTLCTHSERLISNRVKRMRFIRLHISFTLAAHIPTR